MTRAFKRALYWSLGAHAALLLLIIVNPSLSKGGPKGQIRYVNLNLGGGGRGGGGEARLAETPLAKASLKDLTTLQKLQENRPDPESSLRHPADKKTARGKTAPDKKAVVTKPGPDAKTEAAGGGAASGGGGSGLTIGGGAPGFGEGTGGGYGDQIAMSDFPFTWYLNTVTDRISARWFQSLVDPGVSGSYRVTVHFRIYRNGSISEVVVREPSGLRALDLSARRAVLEAAPFGPLPPEFDEEYLGILLIFEHSK